MRRYYFIDSENVNDAWIALLDYAAPEDEILVFYTKKSPHMGYESVRRLKESDREVTFLRCFEGQNALDFQLVSEVGYRLNGSGDEEYIIVSNDTGYDAMIRYWKEKGYPVERMTGKRCMALNVPDRKKQSAGTGGNRGEQKNRTAGGMQGAGDTAGHGENLLADTVHSAGDRQALTDVPADLAEKAVIPADPVQDEAEPESSVMDDMADGKPERKSEPEGASDNAAPGSPGQGQAVPEKAADNMASGSPGQGQAAPEKASDNMASGSPGQGQAAPEGAADNAVSGSPGQEYSMPENGTGAASVSGGADGPALDADAGIPETHTQENRQQVEFDEKEIQTILSCIGRNNLTDLHNSLTMIYGEKGKDIYQIVRSGSCQIQPKSWNQKEKFKRYCGVIFVHSDIGKPYPKDFSDFLYSVADKRKNLNSLRAALQTKYGKEKGMKYYSTFKGHIKLMNQM